MNKPLIFDDRGKAKYKQKSSTGEIIQVEVTDVNMTIGPGTWNAIHTLAFYAKTKEEQASAAYAIRTLCRHFPCKSCRQHAHDYIKTHPIDSNNLFKWTWKFHNAVNKNLNKPTMSYKIAYDYYTNIKQN
jgi:hypothetical protein